MNISNEFANRNPKRCSLGAPCGDGIRLGFRGWGQCDLELNPAVPLDLQVLQMGLREAFEEVESTDLLHRLHGDCTLTHGVNAIGLLLKPGGRATAEFLCLGEVLRASLGFLDRKDWISAQAVEKAAFNQPIDKFGVLYPQTMISRRKAEVLFEAAGFIEISVTKLPDPDWQALLPDLVRLDGIDNKVWKASLRNFNLRESLAFDRPSCVLCDRVVTKRDHDRRFFARYCKEHYHVARQRCDAMARGAFSMVVQARRRR